MLLNLSNNNDDNERIMKSVWRIKKKKITIIRSVDCRVHLRNYKVHLFIIIYTIYYGYLTDFSDKSFRTAQGDNPPPTPIMSSWIWLFFYYLA